MSIIISTISHAPNAIYHRVTGGAAYACMAISFVAKRSLQGLKFFGSSVKAHPFLAIAVIYFLPKVRGVFNTIFLKIKEVRQERVMAHLANMDMQNEQYNNLLLEARGRNNTSSEKKGEKQMIQFYERNLEIIYELECKLRQQISKFNV